jgi:hypothetical protein
MQSYLLTNLLTNYSVVYRQESRNL